MYLILVLYAIIGLFKPYSYPLLYGFFYVLENKYKNNYKIWLFII